MSTSTVLLLITTMGLVSGLLLIALSDFAENSLAYAQGNEETNATSDLTNVTSPIASMSVPGQKTFNIFSTEIPDVDEEKLKVAGDAFSETPLLVKKGDNITVNFYNVDPVTSERHTFTIGEPYNVNTDVASGEKGTVTFKADQEGLFTYYCAYHLPVMVGQLQVIP
jgi:nitrous oxide reductase